MKKAQPIALIICPHCGGSVSVRLSTARQQIDWAAVDWSKPTVDIANELGTAASYVSAMRTRHGVRAARKVTARTDWARIDWSRRTSAIAKDLGVSENIVSANRRKHAPDTVRGRA